MTEKPLEIIVVTSAHSFIPDPFLDWRPSIVIEIVAGRLTNNLRKSEFPLHAASFLRRSDLRFLVTLVLPLGTCHL